MDFSQVVYAYLSCFIGQLSPKFDGEKERLLSDSWIYRTAAFRNVICMYI